MTGESPIEDREAERIWRRRNSGVSYDDVGYWKWSQLSCLNTTSDALKEFLEYDATERRLGS